MTQLLPTKSQLLQRMPDTIPQVGLTRLKTAAMVDRAGDAVAHT
jgi:hypothetical protein